MLPRRRASLIGIRLRFLANTERNFDVISVYIRVPTLSFAWERSGLHGEEFLFWLSFGQNGVTCFLWRRQERVYTGHGRQWAVLLGGGASIRWRSPC